MRKFLATVAVVIAASGFMAPAEAAQIKLVDVGTGGCIKPLDGKWKNAGGAFSKVTLDDNVEFTNYRTLKIWWSNAKGELLGCINGYRQTGGKSTLAVSWSIEGTQLTAGGCEISTSSIGCSINNARTVVTDRYSFTGTNSTGLREFKSGGANVYASTDGSLKAYNSNATATFVYSSYTTQAKTANRASR